VPKIRFLNEAIEVEATAGQTIREVAEQHGITLLRGLFPRLHCGGRGWCGRCRVWATGGLAPLTFWERLRRYRGTRRLACQAKIQGDVEVRTTPNAPLPRQTTEWLPDPRPSKWRDRAVEAKPAAAPPAEPKPAATPAEPKPAAPPAPAAAPANPEP
jgi:uncharacterized 2Fe-2S/4Fe-4S cluster protein (DUF4445 family)